MAVLVLLVLCASDCASTPDKVNVLFEVGGTKAHDAVKLPEMLERVLEDTGRFAITISQDRDLFKRESISKFDVVMLYTTRVELNPEQEKGLIEFVDGGGGLVSIHSSTSMDMKSDAFWKLLGGRFLKHGAGRFKVKITGKSHPIVQGMTDFEVTDETYRHTFCPGSKLITLMRRESDSEPVTWVQYYGKGRVFDTALGHDNRTWSNPNFQQLITRALDWAAGKLNP